MALTKLRNTINDRRVKTKEIENATRPLETIERTLPVIRLSGSKPLSNTLRLLRSAKLTPGKYKTFALTITNGIHRAEPNLPGDGTYGFFA